MVVESAQTVLILLVFSRYNATYNLVDLSGGSLTFRSNTGALGGNLYIINNASFVGSGFTFDNGTSTTGGGVYADNSALRVTNATITNNNAAVEGLILLNLL